MSDVRAEEASFEQSPPEHPCQAAAIARVEQADDEMRRVEQVARQAFGDSRRSPVADAAAPTRVLIVRADSNGTSELESLRLADVARDTLEKAGVEVDLINDTPVAGAQSASAHGVMFIATMGGDGRDTCSALIDKLSRRDGAASLAGRSYVLALQGNAAFDNRFRRNLSDALDDAGLLDAGAQARLDRFIGDCEPHAATEESWRSDDPARIGIVNAAHALVGSLADQRAGCLLRTDWLLSRPGAC